MCGEEVRDYSLFCVGKFLSLEGSGTFAQQAKSQASRGAGEVSKVFMPALSFDGL